MASGNSSASVGGRVVESETVASPVSREGRSPVSRLNRSTWSIVIETED